MRLLISFAAVLALAAAPVSTDHFTAAELTAKRAEVMKTMKDGLASGNVATWGNHLLLIAHREKSGQSEFHEKQADILIVRAGKGTIIVGGKMVDAKTTAPGELRGASIEGGQKLSFSAGDVVHIPVRTAHQVILEKGQSVDYLAVKVDVP